MQARHHENYRVNPHRHVKIWFSKDETSFLNSENQLRLVRFRAKNPDDTISFVYSKKLLSVEAQSALEKFCVRHRITPLSIEDDIQPKLVTDSEKQLLRFAEDEIRMNKSDSGGNLAAASDIVRLLSPVFQLGIYADFDIDILTTGLPEWISVEAPFIANIGSSQAFTQAQKLEQTCAPFATHETLYLVNDIFTFPEINPMLSLEDQTLATKRQSDVLNQMHQCIIHAYSNTNDYFQAYIEQFRAKLSDLHTVPGLVEAIVQTTCQPQIQIASGQFGGDIFEIRKNIEKYFASSHDFVILELKKMWLATPVLDFLFYARFNFTLDLTSR